MLRVCAGRHWYTEDGRGWVGLNSAEMLVRLLAERHYGRIRVNPTSLSQKIAVHRKQRPTTAGYG